MKPEGNLFIKAVYGCILTLAALVGLEGKAIGPLTAIVFIIVSLAAVCIAEAYAHRLGAELTSRQISTFTQIFTELLAMRWIMLPGILATLAFLLAALGLYSMSSALFVAQTACCVVLFGIGFQIRRHVGGSMAWSLIDGLFILSVGLAVVALKLLAK
jgi:hypothetical protein